MEDPPAPIAVIDEDGFERLVSAVIATHRTIAPRLRDSSVVLAEIDSVHDICRGITLDQQPGSCRVEPLREGDTRRFAWAVGPHSAKALQHPARRPLFEATLDGEQRVTIAESVAIERRPLAIIGLRPCDVAAAGVLARVVGDDAGAWSDPFVVVVNCTEPGGTCFCVSMDTGPSLSARHAGDVDVVLIERGGDAPEYLVTHLSDRGEELLALAEPRRAEEVDHRWAREADASARERMGRRLDTDALAERLVATLDSPRWDDVAQRCLSCGNCTMVCPTCFCSSVQDSSSLDGTSFTRSQVWDSCFSLDHSHLHGGSVRSTTSDRYRQWLTHKLSTWWAQFGESGCVGCGRCISWCPVGIDIVEEANALSAEAAATDEPYPATPITEVLVRRRGEAYARNHRRSEPPR